MDKKEKKSSQSTLNSATPPTGYNALFSLIYVYFVTNSHRKCFGSVHTYIQFLPYSQQAASSSG